MVDMSVISSTSQQIEMKLSHQSLASPIKISFIYASYDGRERRSLWHDLVSVNTSYPWMVVGDFNVVSSLAEILGGNPMLMSLNLIA